MNKKKPKDKNRKLRRMKEENQDVASTIKKVKKYILEYVENQTSKPVLTSINNSPDVALKIGNLLVTFYACIGTISNCQHDFSLRTSSSISHNDINRLEILTKKSCFSEDDKVFFGHLISKSCSKPCLIPYISRQINWIVVSILSAHYLSSIILMRSIFELTIDLLANNTKVGMSEKIDNISFLDDNQKRDIKKTWRSLCSWSHPYEKWLKNMCSRYMAHPPLYHPEHFKTSIEFLEKVMDLFLVVCKEHFKMNIKGLGKRIETQWIDLSKFRLFVSRF